ncbi:SNF2 helicase associated domain-containing protein [Cohnella sp. GCM10027633]|uniref:SNF2 helicase associated domain-containing protein n=1 Tax=unclassified Cohnella TaxID=2636738 RepID=UPI00362C6DF3
MASNKEQVKRLLDRATVERLCAESIAKQGEAMLRGGQVSSLKQETAGGVFAAVVKTNPNGRFEVEISIQGPEKIEASCTCDAYGATEAFCPHIAAALLALAEDEQQAESSQPVEISDKDAQLTKQVIYLFDRDITRQSELMLEEEAIPELTQELEVEFNCRVMQGFSSRPMFAVTMKLGVTRLYIVQRMKDFLNNVEGRNPMTFAKHFAYDPLEHVFKEADDRFIRLMIEAMRAEEIYKDLFHSFSSYSHREERILMIPPAIWERMLPLIEHVNMRYEDKAGNSHRMRVMEGTLPIFAQLDRAGDSGYQLEFEGLKNAIFLDNYGTAVVNGMLFLADGEQLKRMSEVKRMFHYENRTRLLIQPDQLEPFLERVVRGLKPFMDVEISPQIADRIVNPPLQARMHLDYQDHKLQASLEYVYDDIVIRPLPRSDTQTSRPDVILMRDVEREHRIMSLIERAAFKFNGKDVYLDQEDDIYDFLFGLLPLLANDVAIYSTASVKDITRAEEYRPKARLDVDPHTEWLEVSFDMEGMDTEEIQKLLRNLVEKKKYYRTSNGAFLSLEQDSFKEIHRLFDELDLTKPDMNGNRLRMPAVRGFQLMDQFGATPGVQLGRSLRKLWDNLRNPDNLDFELPAELDPILRDYQKYGYQWLKTLSYYGLGGILADDMGLGKTIQSIAYVVAELQERKRADSDQSEETAELRETPKHAPVLIVSPASLIYNWEREFKKFAPGVRTVVAAGDRQERSERMVDLSSADVWITSYPLLRRDIEWYEKQRFRALFLDEAQAIKNHASLTAHAVRRLRAAQRFALTGTPIENSLDELWSIFDVVFPGLFGGRKAFADLPREKIARIIKPFILRRLKSEVLKELPDKIESVQPSELSLEQKQLYMVYLEKLQNDIARDLADNGFQRSRMRILAGLTRLRQLCCHPALFIEGYEGTSGKLEQLLEIVEECQGSRKRMLIFSQFTSMLDIIRKQLDERELSYFYLDGSTPTHNRIDMCQQFNDGERDMFLISLKAGGTGLNLTGADTVVLFDLWWNPAVEQQAADRAHRIGQKNVVQVIKLVAQGTIEEKMLELQQRKKDLIDEVIQSGDAAISSLTEEDIRELLEI